MTRSYLLSTAARFAAPDSATESGTVGDTWWQANKRLTPTSDLGKYKEGTPLASQANVAGYIRLLVNEGRDEADYTTLTDAAIMSHVKGIDVPADADPETVELAIIESIEAAETVSKSEPEEEVIEESEAGSAADIAIRDAEAYGMGHKLDAAALSALSGHWEIQKKSGIMPLVHMLNLERCWGKQGMLSTPIGGSGRYKIEGRLVLAVKTGKDEYEVLPQALQNLRPDKYKVKSGKKTVSMSWYGDVFDSTPAGQELKKQLDQYDLAKQRNPQAPKALLDLDEHILIEQQDTLRKGRSFQIGQLRKATRCWRQFQAVNELKTCGAVIALNGDKTVKETTAPITLFDWHDRIDEETGLPAKDSKGNVIRDRMGQVSYSIGTFLNFDVQKAAKNGGTKAALEATIERETEGGTGGGDDSEGLDITIRNAKQFESVTAELAWGADDVKFLGDILSEMHRGENGFNDDLIRSTFRAAKLYDYLCGKRELQKRNLFLIEQENKKIAAENAAKEKALETAG